MVYFCIAFLGGLVTHKYSIELTLRAFMIRKKMALKSLCCINNSAEILILFTSTNRLFEDVVNDKCSSYFSVFTARG